MSGESTEGVRGLTLNAEEEKQVREFIANIPSFNSVMKEFSTMVNEGQIEAMSQALAALRFLKDGLNDEAIESLSKLGGRLTDVASAASSEQSMAVIGSLSSEGKELSELIKDIGRMHRDGVFDSVVSAAYALKFLKDGLNDEAIENIASGMADMLSISKKYSSLLSGEELPSALATVSRLERDGALDALVDAAYIIKFLRDGLNDEALSNIASLLSELLRQWHSLHNLIDMLSSPVATRVFNTLTDESLEQRLEKAPPRKGGMSLLSLSDPDVRKGFGVVFELLKIFGQEFKTEVTTDDLTDKD
ncbi:MAG: DUF1641 domain-containing protein [Thermoplasmata archaeon]|nr:DUF1641 domain-containing protein [Candidatus Sysuiplasma acidicola]